MSDSHRSERAGVKSWPTRAGVKFEAIAGEVRQVPGSRTAQGHRALSAIVRGTLDQVRRNIRDRAAHQS